MRLPVTERFKGRRLKLVQGVQQVWEREKHIKRVRLARGADVREAGSTLCAEPKSVDEVR